MSPSLPEVWLRGPVAGFPSELMPVVHALLQIREELARVVEPLSFEQLWARPGGGTPVGFHIIHLAGSLDRLLTYARGEALSDAQRAALVAEDHGGLADHQAAPLLRAAHQAIDSALDQVRTTSVDTLDEPRPVGRAGLPSTVRGLLFHAAEHAQRHAGQIVSTARIVHGLRAGSGA